MCGLLRTARGCTTTRLSLCCADSKSRAEGGQATLAETRPVFDQDTAIHHDEDSSRTGFLCGFFVDDFLLHPDGGNFQLDRLIDNFFHEFRPAKNIDDVD